MDFIDFHGEITNHNSLCDVNGISQKVKDQELVSLLYSRYKEDVVHGLEGRYAFAIADGRDCFIVRDRFGFKTMYYAMSGGYMHFGSNIKNLIQRLKLRVKINPNAIYHYLTFGALPEDITWFEGIHKLEPGTYILFRNGFTNKHKYYDVSQIINEPLDDDNVCDRIDCYLKDFFAEKNNYQVALSGGTDSCLLAAVSSNLKKNYSAVSVFINNKMGEEAERIYRIKDYITPNITFISCTVSSQSISELAKYISEYIYEPMQLMDMVLMRALLGLDDGIEYIFGEGADELGGYQEYLKVDAINTLMNKRKNWRAVKWHYKGYCIAGKHVTGINEEEKKRIWVAEPCECSYEYIYRMYEKINCSVSDSFYRKLQCVDFSFRLPEYLLRRLDVLGDLFGKRVCLPFLSRPLAEYCMHMNKTKMMSGKRVKCLFKDLLYRYIPSDVWEQRKLGLGDGLGDFVGGVLLQNYISEIEADYQNPLFGYVDREKVGWLVREQTRLAWNFYSLGIWLKTLDKKEQIEKTTTK